MKILNRLSPVFVIIFIFSALLIFSCKKEKSQVLSPDEELQANIASSESDAEAENDYNNVFDDVMGVNNDVGMAGTGMFGRVSGSSGIDSVYPCAIVTTVHLSNNFFPVKITIDFGTGCTGRDGHVRKGKIISTYTNRLLYPGASATTVFDGFYIDSVHIEGQHVITNTSGPSTNNYSLNFTLDVDGKLSKPSGNYSEWHSHKVIRQSEGAATLSLPLDDTYKIGGSATGKVKKDNLIVGWGAEITDSLIKKFTCHWISKGKVRIIRESLSVNSQWVGTLDYGNGTCDNGAVLTINNTTHQITLH
jgi:hypothetical protein